MISSVHADSKTDAIPPCASLDIRFPLPAHKAISQDDEWCEVVEGNVVTRVRFHDYAQVFSIAGLYDQLFGGPKSKTQCVSPQVLAGLLREQLPLVVPGAGMDGDMRAKLRILDFGAGNGMIAEEVRAALRDQADGHLENSTTIVGFDILPEAKMAAGRDRPGVYDAYVAADITEYVKAPPKDATEARIFAQGFNVLVTASALAFGDATVGTFKAAVSLVEEGGLLVFNVKEDFFDLDSQMSEDSDFKEAIGEDDFSGFVQDAIDRERLTIIEKKRYCHRYSVTGEPLYYVAIVAIKHASLG